ncbi:hypothetical protein PF005_g1846 [Phytophthora fragariae]|uniref:GYF domain-containing protein n=1 Tax=Phytophthora fragariae TaxID=53985 RepID=A0A6A3MBP9_9STRA|nr:hypothetical protein PF003_g29206 [Phytophthora fragariae]KAE8947454.1 hypothetical protein PF009_g2944 [Phytophthora fragariae]KAE9027300.1 hypothetical protein PF011_g2105 [Phytophthora fragariae]KAE9134554.1 hypothetical protein PF010_g2408 [Phytophthora fragariae]KAE9135050.1 hypothetical protein PF007_g2698 [Phytophthora fragariae]
MSSSPSNDDDFVTKTTKHRKKQQQQQTAVGGDAAKKPPTGPSNGASSSSTSNISLRPRTMFAMKGRGRTESEGSAYRPQWSKDGEGFVSSGAGGPTSFKDAATSGSSDEPRGERRKSKVLRYTKEELLALHFTTAEAPTFPPDTSVASEHSLPPVSTLPFDYEEIYKQWSLNRNRGRGRGRGNAPAGGAQGTRGHQERGARGEDADAAKQTKEEHHRHNERDSTWERGTKIEASHGDDVWDDVLEPGADSNEMDLSSMAEAAEKFRREMDAMKEELQGPKADPDEMKDDLDAFDKKLEDAAAAGQFEDSDNEEAQWDDPTPEEEQSANDANGPLGDHSANLLGRQSSGGRLFDALEPAGDQLVLEEKSSFSLSQMPADERFPGLSPLRLEVEDEWFYLDPQGLQQGPFKTAEMREWFEAGYFKPHLPIRFGREGNFGPLASAFGPGQMPFAAPPTRMNAIGGMHVDPRQSEQQRLLELQRQQQQQQQQQMMQLQQQQQQRMLQEEKIRMEMQRLEIVRQQQQSQLYQQQQMLQHQQEQQRQQQLQQQQQQQQMLLQQQSSWQRSQREGIMSALGIFGGNQESNIAANDNFRSDGMQIQFQSDYRTQHELNLQNPQPIGQNAMFLNDERRDQAFWPNAVPEMSGLESATSSLGGLQQGRPASPMAPETAQIPAPKNSPAAPVVDAWGAVPKSPERPSATLHGIQNEEKRRAVQETRGSPSKTTSQTSAQHEESNDASPVKTTTKTDESEKKNMSPVKKNEKKAAGVKGEINAWGTKSTSAASNNSKSLKDIQQEEQREMLSKMGDAKSDTSNLAQMGAQLKMMLGVDSTAVPAAPSTVAPTPPSAPAPPAPAAKPTTPPAPTPVPAPASAAPAASPWGAPVAVAKSTTSKSMRDILAEEECLAQERAKANETAPTSSHWMNIVAGNKVAAAAIPKPSRSVLGPVPASVLKSRQQIRVTNGAAKPSPPKPESDASFWNFGAAQSAAGKESSSSPSNAFGSNNVSSEFMTWALKQLKTIDSNANVTLLEYCASVEDPGEIREYLAAYLGSTPRVSAFATEFIQRKKTQRSGKKSPVHQDAQQRAAETGSSNKRGKRRAKGQKVDPSLLNYSVGS